MKIFGWLALVLGATWAIVAFNMDVSVATGYGRVNNIGLMASRQNHIIIGSFITLCGLLIVIFGKARAEGVLTQVKCPFCAELISPEAIKCKHCGSDVSEVMNTLRKKSFKPTDMSFDEFFIRTSDGFEINKESISILVNRMKDAREGVQSINIYDGYKNEIEELKNKLPSSISEIFEMEVRRHF